MKQIKLSQGQVAIVDDDDFEELSKYKWHTLRSKSGVCRARRTKRSHTGNVLMHRQIMTAPDGMEVDHVNHDTLDNRKRNLRIVTKSQNQQNRLKRASGAGKYKGTCKNKFYDRWIAQIRVKGEPVYLGCFETEKESAEAYDKAAIKYFGAYACLNFPERRQDNV